MRERTIAGLKTIEIPGDPKKGTIVLMHGFGADCYDLVSLSKTYEGPTWLFPQGPVKVMFSEEHSGYAWFPLKISELAQAIREKRYDEISQAFPPELTQAHLLMDQFLTELDVPRSEIILGGFSQGAVLTIEVALRSYQKIGALLLFSGTLLNELNWKQLAPQHAHTPFFQSHGIHDQLMPISKAEELEKLLIDGGLVGKLHTFQGGHEIPRHILQQLSAFLNKLFH